MSHNNVPVRSTSTGRAIFPTTVKKIGTINDRAIYEESSEWKALLTSVTVDDLHLPDGASEAIRNRLRHHQKKVQARYRNWLREQPLDTVAADAGDSWSSQAHRDEAARRIREAENEIREQHRTKRLPGLRRLLAEASASGDETTQRIAEQLIAEQETKAALRKKSLEEAERREAFLSTERSRLSGMSLDDLLQVKTDDWDVRQIVAELVAPQCTTVREIAEKVVLSESTVRTYLDQLGIAPCFTDRYTAGGGPARRDVTAHYYRRDVITAVGVRLATTS